MFFRKDEFNEKTVINPTVNSTEEDQKADTEPTVNAITDNNHTPEENNSEPDKEITDKTIIYAVDEYESDTEINTEDEPTSHTVALSDAADYKDSFVIEPKLETDVEQDDENIAVNMPYTICEESPFINEEVEDNTVSDRFAKADFKESDRVTKNKKGKKKKKASKKKKSIIIASVSLLLVATILLVAFNFTAVLGFFIKNFCSDATYFKFVEAVNFSSYSDDLIDYYTQFDELFSDKQCKDFSMALDISDTALNIADEFSISEYGLSLGFIKNTTIDGTFNINKKDIHAKATAQINNEDIASGEYIKIAKDGEVYYGAPTFTDHYLLEKVTPSKTLELSEILDDPDVKKVLPFGKDKSDDVKDEFKDFALKYVKIIANEINDVKSEDKEVFVGNTEEKVRALQVTIDLNTFNAIKKNVYTQLKDDEYVKKCIYDVALVLVKKGKIETKDELYNNIISSINKDLKQIEKYQKSPVNKQLFTMVDYVNSKHEIIGRDLITDGKVVFSTLKIDDNYTFNCKPVINGFDCEISGEGAIVSNVLSGTFSFSAEDYSMCSISLSEINLETFKGGRLSGTVILSPGADLWDSLPENLSLLSHAKLKLKNKFDITKDTISFDSDLLTMNLHTAKISFAANKAKQFEIKKPGENSIIVEDKSEFFSSFKILNALSAIKNSGIMDNIEDADKFVATLEDIGVPKPVVDGISVVLNMVAIKDKVNGFVNGIKDKIDYLF